jgi:DNA helicase-2/ATP-dependent DNA helicase PcrA
LRLRTPIRRLHKAKGLEFSQVFLPAWEAGAFPSDYGDRDEERRLAYVALTRGMHRITISHCGFRRGPALRSPFIDDIPETHRVLGWLRDQHRQRTAHSPRMDHRDHTTPYRRF